MFLPGHSSLGQSSDFYMEKPSEQTYLSGYSLEMKLANVAALLAGLAS